MKKTKIGIIGCGNISKAYFNGVKKFHGLEIVACADIRKEAAEERAAEFEVKPMSVSEIVKASDIEILINLTIPQAHAEIDMLALNNGKHVHSEKPFAISLEEAKKVLDLAKEKKLRVGCAPDTFLSATQQTSRKIIDDGWIGKPISGTAVFAGRGPESWHPNPFFFYDIGGGPMLDIGPYYLTALVNLLGPIKRILGLATKSFKERTATCQEHFNAKIPVRVPTHNMGILEFESGVHISIFISFDIHKHGHYPIEIYGTEGSLMVPDPNNFHGEIKLYRPEAEGWQLIPFSHRYKENSRSIAVADMASAIQNNRPHRASGELAYHILEAMIAFETLGENGGIYQMTSTCERPAPLETGVPEGLIR